MSWLFSQALVEAFSAAACLDGEPSAQLNVMPTPHKFWRNDKMIEPLNHSRFGLTCAVLTEGHGEALLTWYRAGFRAKTSVQLGKAQGSKREHAAGFGSKWHALSVRFDRDSRLWRTHQTLWDEALISSSVTFPKWGMTVDGVLFQRSMPAHLTSASARGSSALIPTPTTPNGGRVNKPEDVLNKGRSIDGKKRQVSLESWARMWPTPTVHGNNNRKGISKNSGDGLATAVKTWPTPNAADSKRSGNFGRGNPTLAGAVKLLPTPTVNNSKNNGGPSQARRHTPGLDSVAGGKLNPRWVEWLMGWPIGWTSLEPLETGKFQKWLASHGTSSINNTEAQS